MRIPKVGGGGGGGPSGCDKEARIRRPNVGKSNDALTAGCRVGSPSAEQLSFLFFLLGFFFVSVRVAYHRGAG